MAPALIAAHVGARAVMPFVMFLLPAARSDGLAFAAGRPSGVSVAIAAALGFLALLFCLGLAHALVALVVLAIVVALLCWLATRQIGGQTGDVLGAVEQVSEIVDLAGGAAVDTAIRERERTARRAVGGASASRPASAPRAPSTMLRMVQLATLRAGAD